MGESRRIRESLADIEAQLKSDKDGDFGPQFTDDEYAEISALRDKLRARLASLEKEESNEPQ